MTTGEGVAMQHDEFVGQVLHQARLASTGEAERAIRVTLETLGERITSGSAENLAAQLPHEIGENLRRAAATHDTGEHFGLDEFFDRITSREIVDLPSAVFYARTVLEMVGEATTGGLIKVRDQLPDELDRLFTAGSTGHMPPAE